MPQRLGQHWLIDQQSLQDIVAQADISGNDLIFEIGTGLGSLTDQLLRTPAKIISLEYDAKLYAQAQKKYTSISNQKLSLKLGDIRQFDWSTLGKNYKICANIPYYLSSNLLRALTDIINKPKLVVLLLAQDLARKLAQTRKQTLLSALVQTYYKVQLGQSILPQHFQPPPKVISQIAILKYEPELSDLTLAAWPMWVKLLKISFANNRKQLGVNLALGFQLSKVEVEQLMTDLPCDFQQRAQELNHQQWWALFQKFYKLNLLG